MKKEILDLNSQYFTQFKEITSAYEKALHDEGLCKGAVIESKASGERYLLDAVRVRKAEVLLYGFKQLKSGKYSRAVQNIGYAFLHRIVIVREGQGHE